MKRCITYFVTYNNINTSVIAVETFSHTVDDSRIHIYRNLK